MFSSPALITGAHNVQKFDCGNTALNDFLVKFALTNTNAGLARTFVTTLEQQSEVIGCFSLSAGSIERDHVPARVAKGTPCHPIPIALLARLAVDLKFQEQGLGHGLLKHALLKILEASRTIGIRAVLVHANNQQAVDFYAKYGFAPSPTNSFHMMLMLKDINKTIAAE